MSRLAEPSARSPFSGPTEPLAKSRNIPIFSSTVSPGDPMDVTPQTSTTMGPPVNSSPEMENGGANNGGANNAKNTNNANTNGSGSGNGNGNADSSNQNNNSANQTIGAAAAAQQPKVVQTAFIHKLYNMLEDQSIQHLISWSSSNESFVMSPSSEFSKVLAQYFKHTNISSFVRQLNMYGFHKVSDVFHTGSPDSTLWEFKHGNGNFKRGDLVGLREIKRRASRHALIHRDSFSHKPGVAQPGGPSEPMPDATEVRLLNLENSVYDMHQRLSRTEESNYMLSTRCQALTENLVRSHQFTHSMSHFIMSMVPDPENPLHRDIVNMQKDVSRQLESMRALETPHELLLSTGRQPYFSNMSIDPNPPLSPRQMPQDDSRRPSMPDTSKGNMIKPPVPQHLAVSPRRYGSIGAANMTPSYSRPQPPPQTQAGPHPLSSVTSPPGPNLARRHTSADIRQHGWPPVVGNSPLASGNSSVQWPSSPHRTPNASDQHVRDVLAQYEMGGSKRQQQDVSRQGTPPLTADTTPSTLSAESGWGVGGSKFPRPTDLSLPATRRSSMASNVHSLLNPAETAERADEDDPMAGEDRKRKRLQ